MNQRTKISTTALPSPRDATAAPSRAERVARFGVARTPFTSGLLGVLLGVAACRLPDPTAPLDDDAVARRIIALETRLEKQPDDVEARRELGLIHWGYRGDSAKSLAVLSPLVDGASPDGAAQALAMSIAHSRLDDARVWALSTAILTRAAKAGADRRIDEDEALDVALSTTAARHAAAAWEDLPDGDGMVLSWVESIDVAALPADTALVVRGLASNAARRAGRDVAGWYAGQGCVQEWSVGPMEGTLGELELVRFAEAAKGPARVDAEVVTAKVGCMFRVWNPAPLAGIRRLRTAFETDVPFVLEVAGETPLRAYVDGHEVLATDDVTRHPATAFRRWVEVAPGTHVLEVQLAMPRASAWVSVRALRDDGAPVQIRGNGAELTSAVPKTVPPVVYERGMDWPQAAPSLGLASRSDYPFRLWLALDAALANGDTEAAERVVTMVREGGLERSAELLLALADFERADPTRPGTISGPRERAALEKAVRSDPLADQAHLRLLEARLDRGEEAAVIAALAEIGERHLRGTEGQLLRWRAYSMRGSEVQADMALAAAKAAGGHECSIALAERRVARERDQVEREDAAVAALAQCPEAATARAETFMNRGQHERAAAVWSELLTHSPDALEAHEALARIAAATGATEEAIARYETVLRHAPYRLGAAMAIVDLIGQRGELQRAHAKTEEIIARVPHSLMLRRFGAEIGLADPLLRERIDGLAAIAAYREAKGEVEGVREVLVLDRDVARIHANGGQRHLIHQIVHLLGKEALDRYGELRFPPGRQVLTLRSIKPDGSIHEPEVIAGKDGWSLRGLEIGDYVEIETIDERDAIGILPGYVDTGHFRFQDPETPYHWSELIVIHPIGMPIRIETRNDAPPVERSEEGEDVRLRFLARNAARRRAEPFMRDGADELPMVRVFTDFDPEGWIRGIARELRPRVRANEELRDLVLEIAGGIRDPMRRAQALWDWVMANIEDEGGLGTPATATLAARQGSALLLLYAMLQEAGVPADLVLLRERFGQTERPGDHPAIDEYGTAAIRLRSEGESDASSQGSRDEAAGRGGAGKGGAGKGEEREEVSGGAWIAMGAKVIPFDWLPPLLWASDGYRVPLRDEDVMHAGSSRVRTPTKGSLPDSRHFELNFQIGADGTGTLRGRLELSGFEAVVWRDALSRVDADRVQELFQQAELSNLARGASIDLVALDVSPTTDLRAPLVLTFEASVSDFTRKAGPDLLVPTALVPMNLAANYARLPARETGLVIGYAPRSSAVVEIELKGGPVFGSVLDDARLEAPWGHFERRTTAGKPGGAKLTYTLEASLVPSVVKPEEYGEVLEFAREVDATEQVILRAR